MTVVVRKEVTNVVVVREGIQGETGDTGPAGPANSLAIGTVTTGSAGSSAAATITGTAPTQTLSLTIPRGDTGAAGAGVPVGGSTGQALVKKSNTDRDTEWSTITSGVTSVNTQTGAVVLSNTDVGAAATSHTHAASDVTGTAITAADTGTVTNTMTAGLLGRVTLPLSSGDLYSSSMTGNTVTYTRSTLYATPLYFPQSMTIDRIGIHCFTANGNTAYVALATAAADGTPSTVWVDASVSLTNNTTHQIVVSTTVPKGLCWALVVCTGGSASPTLLGSWPNADGHALYASFPRWISSGPDFAAKRLEAANVTPPLTVAPSMSWAGSGGSAVAGQPPAVIVRKA